MRSILFFAWVAALIAFIATARADFELNHDGTQYIFAHNEDENNFYLKSIKVNDVMVYEAIDDNGDPAFAPVWKVIFMRHQITNPYEVRSIEGFSTDAEITSTQQTDSYVNVQWHYTNPAYGINLLIQTKFMINYGTSGDGKPKDSLFCEIQVANFTPDTGIYEYRLMEVHFPFMLLGPSSFVYVPPNPFPPEPTPTPFPPVQPGDDYLTFPSYLLKNPSGNILPELPAYATPTPRPSQTPGGNKILWEGNYSGTLFHYYYPAVSNESQNPGYYGLYLAAYNTYGHPCQINFAKNNDPDYTSDSFYYDLVMYPRGDIIGTSGNDFMSMPPGFLIEICPLKGDWYTASQHYLSVTESLRNYTPPAGSPAPAYSATPIWNTTPMEDNSHMPEWMKKCPFLYYVSPQVSETSFFVSPGWPVRNRALQFKEFMFDTGQSPAIATPLAGMDEFMVMTWHSNFYGPAGHPYFFPEWAGGNMPLRTWEDRIFYRDHSAQMIDQLQSQSDQLHILFNPGGAMYHWNGEGSKDGDTRFILRPHPASIRPYCL